MYEPYSCIKLVMILEWPLQVWIQGVLDPPPLSTPLGPKLDPPPFLRVDLSCLPLKNPVSASALRKPSLWSKQHAHISTEVHERQAAAAPLE